MCCFLYANFSPSIWRSIAITYYSQLKISFGIVWPLIYRKLIICDFIACFFFVSLPDTTFFFISFSLLLPPWCYRLQYIRWLNAIFYALVNLLLCIKYVNFYFVRFNSKIHIYMYIAIYNLTCGFFMLLLHFVHVHIELLIDGHLALWLCATMCKQSFQISFRVVIFIDSVSFVFFHPNHILFCFTWSSRIHTPTKKKTFKIIKREQ